MTWKPKLKSGTLSDWWLDKLSEKMEVAYPDIIGHGRIVDHWKVDGWNDGTTTLTGVYKLDGEFWVCCFPDYGSPSKHTVKPRYAHTGWQQ